MVQRRASVSTRPDDADGDGDTKVDVGDESSDAGSAWGEADAPPRIPGGSFWGAAGEYRLKSLLDSGGDSPEQWHVVSQSGEAAVLHYGIRDEVSLEVVVRIAQAAVTARILDAGTTPQGIPYAIVARVMEQRLVELLPASGDHRADALRKHLPDVVKMFRTLHTHELLLGDFRVDDLTVSQQGGVSMARPFVARHAPHGGMARGRPSPGDAFSPHDTLHGGAWQESDWWRLGAMLYWLLTGTDAGGRPFDPMAVDSSQQAPLTMFFEPMLEPAARRAALERIEGTWRPLIGGLLTVERQSRWCAKEVQAWLDGRAVLSSAEVESGGDDARQLEVAQLVASVVKRGIPVDLTAVLNLVGTPVVELVERAETLRRTVGGALHDGLADLLRSSGPPTESDAIIILATRDQLFTSEDEERLTSVLAWLDTQHLAFDRDAARNEVMRGLRDPAALRQRVQMRRRTIARARSLVFHNILRKPSPTFEEQVLLLVADERHFHTHEVLWYARNERDRLIAERNTHLAADERRRAQDDRAAAKNAFGTEMQRLH